MSLITKGAGLATLVASRPSGNTIARLAPSYVGIGTIFNATSSSYVVDTPDNVVQNDVLVAIFYYGNKSATTVTPPSDWNQVAGSPQETGNTSNYALHCYWRYAPSSPAANYTWGLSPGQGGAAFMIALRNCHQTNPVDALAFNSGGSNTSAVGSSISPTTADAVLLNAVCTAGGRTFTPPGSTNEICADQNSLNAVYKVLSASGATGTLTHTISANANWATLMIALRGT